jgi:hypothetical protein
MKHLLFLSLPLLLFLISCSENETEPITYTDTELREKLIGTWSTDYITLRFDANDVFIQKMDAETIRGTFDVLDGNLIYKNITEWNLDTSKHNSSFPLSSYKLNFEGDKLYLHLINILTRIGEHNDSLWGEWYVYHWAHKSSDPLTFGKLESTYEFNKDSMLVIVRSAYSFDSSLVFQSTFPFTYNPPELNIDNNPKTFIAEFHKEQMWWSLMPAESPVSLTKHKFFK